MELWQHQQKMIEQNSQVTGAMRSLIKEHEEKDSAIRKMYARLRVEQGKDADSAFEIVSKKFNITEHQVHEDDWDNEESLAELKRDYL